MADYSGAYENTYWQTKETPTDKYRANLPPPLSERLDMPQEGQKSTSKRRAAYVPVYVGGYLLGVLEWRTDGSTVHLHQASMDVSYYMSIDDFTEHLPLFYGTEIEALNHFERGNITHG